MIPDRTLSNKGYIEQTGHLKQPDKSTSGEIGATIQPHNIQPKVYPEYGISWGKGGTEKIV